MSCSGKASHLRVFTAAFFPKHGALVMVGLYFIGILVSILTAFVLKGSLFKGEAVPFVMELPNYRMPGAKNGDSFCGKRRRISCRGLLR